MEKKNENDVPETLHGMTLGNIAEACGGTYIGAKEQEEQEITGKNILFLHTGGTPLFYDCLYAGKLKQEGI